MSYKNRLSWIILLFIFYTSTLPCLSIIYYLLSIIYYLLSPIYYLFDLETQRKNNALPVLFYNSHNDKQHLIRARPIP